MSANDQAVIDLARKLHRADNTRQALLSASWEEFEADPTPEAAVRYLIDLKDGQERFMHSMGNAVSQVMIDRIGIDPKQIIEKLKENVELMETEGFVGIGIDAETGLPMAQKEDGSLIPLSETPLGEVFDVDFLEGGPSPDEIASGDSIIEGIDLSRTYDPRGEEDERGV